MDRLRQWWGTKLGKIGLITAGVFVGLVIIGLAVPAEDKKSDASPSTTAVVDTTPETTAATTPAEVKPPDSGRMSEGEWQQWSDAVDEFESEISDYATQLGGKCAVLFSNGDLADGSECVGDAWSGTEGAAEFAYYTTTELIDDTLKTCRVALQGYRNRLNAWYVAHKLGAKAAENLQADDFIEYVKIATAKQPAYLKLATKARATCPPT